MTNNIMLTSIMNLTDNLCLYVCLVYTNCIDKTCKYLPTSSVSVSPESILLHVKKKAVGDFWDMAKLIIIRSKFESLHCK